MTNPLQKNFSSQINRNDNHLEQKWLGKRHVYTEQNPYKDPGIDFSDDPGMTDPSAAHDCDINNIVATYHKTGILPGSDVEQVFADVSDAPSYQDAMQIVVNSNSQFMTLDAKTRKYFDNDVTKFLAAIDDPSMGSELVRLGLAEILPPTSSPAGPEAAATPSRSSQKGSKSSPTVTDDEK